MLIAARATCAQLELSAHLLWLARETSVIFFLVSAILKGAVPIQKAPNWQEPPSPFPVPSPLPAIKGADRKLLDLMRVLVRRAEIKECWHQGVSVLRSVDTEER